MDDAEVEAVSEQPKPDEIVPEGRAGQTGAVAVRELDLMTRYLADHVCAVVVKRTAPGLQVRQAVEAKNNGIRPELQRIWAIFDVRRDEWLDVYVDPDK